MYLASYNVHTIYLIDICDAKIKVLYDKNPKMPGSLF